MPTVVVSGIGTVKTTAPPLTPKGGVIGCCKCGKWCAGQTPRFEWTFCWRCVSHYCCACIRSEEHEVKCQQHGYQVLSIAQVEGTEAIPELDRAWDWYHPEGP